MKKEENIIDLQKKSVIALRFIYPIWAIVGMFSIMYVPSKLIVFGDATLTASNILANELLFRLGIVGSLMTQLLFVFAVLVLYQLFKSVDKNQSMVMLVLALVSVPIAMLNTLNRVAALLLLESPEQMMFFLNLNVEGMMIATIFWGLWLFPLAYLIHKSNYFPKIFSILVAMAGFGYVLDSLVHFLVPSMKAVFLPVVSIFTIGEVLFMLWVIFKGAKISNN